jgi:hypothetical protein
VFVATVPPLYLPPTPRSKAENSALEVEAGKDNRDMNA